MSDDAPGHESSLLDAWRSGNSLAGERLLAGYRARLLRFFDLRVSLDAEDLTQRTLLACIEGRDTIRNAASFRAYVFGVARHVLLQHMRHRAKDARTDDFSDVAGVDPGPSPSRVVAAHQEQHLLLRVLQALSLDNQIIIELFYWEGMSPQEIGDALGMPRSTVTTRLHRARQELREGIGRLAGPDPARASLTKDLERWAASLRDLALPSTDGR